MRQSKLVGPEFDVIICGGGSAGTAAYSAAKAGARTLRLERLVRVREIDVGLVQEQLLRQRAILPLERAVTQ